MKNQFGPKLVKKIFERDDGMCVYCGGNALEIDHVIPCKDGGPAISSNGVCVCRRCNHKKKNHMDDPTWLTQAIFWLLQKGENIAWMDDFYPPEKQ